MIIELSKPLTTAQSEHSTLVVFSRISKKADKTTVVKIDSPEISELLASDIESKVLTGRALEVCFYRHLSVLGHEHLAVVGLGQDATAETARQAAAGLLNQLKTHKVSGASVWLDTMGFGKKEFAHAVQAFAEGLGLTDYEFDELKSKKTKKESDTAKKAELHISLVTKLSTDAAVKNALHTALILTESVNFSRRLGDLPGNLMTPTDLADSIVAAVKGTGIKTEIWDKARIKKERMGGLLGVAQGSDEEPRFIVLKYNGAGAKNKQPVVFVGKGLTFDSGGISLKPGAAMEEMKYDMCGGANVLGAVLAMAKLKLKMNIVGLVPATENMPNGRATKPGDVHTARNGITFEVNNTDAEGRLILSDALCYGSELKPRLMVDAATLTGAIVMALGNLHTGYFTRNDALAKKIEQAAATSGEWVWRMPLTDFHVKDMKGTYADLSNISSAKGAGSATAAAYLEQFVEEGIPWAHFDIAGTAWAVGSRLPYCPKKGASGAMVRTFVELAKIYES